MKNHTIALLSLLWIGISANSFGQGTILVQHSGSADPTTEGFSLNIGPGITVGPVTNDLGMDAWRTTATSGGIGLFGYQQLLTPQQQTQVTGSDWMMSVTLRIVQSSDTIQHIFAGFNTGSQGFGLGFGLNGNGDPFVEVDESSLSPIYTLAGAGSSYNNYELIYNSANNLASLWVDGVDEINNISGIQTSSSPMLVWGMSQPRATSFEANWNLVSLSVPEPSPSWLLLIGGGAWFYLRRKYHG
ncbi:MAG TPA: PEP-CTERM sorting domain-containing protein [Verrucomicrobiae bacterium]